MSLVVEQLWRYPVMTLAGERLEAAELTITGIRGDRVVHVRGPEGVRTSRRHHGLLGLSSSLGPGGAPLIDGRPWDDPASLVAVRRAAGDDAWLAEYGRGGEIRPGRVRVGDAVRLVRSGTSPRA